MTRILTALLVLWALAIVPVFAAEAASSPKLPPDLARAAAAYDQAQIHNDGAALQRLLADDSTLVSGAAQVETKAQFISDSNAIGFSLTPYIVEDPIAKLWEGRRRDGGCGLAGGYQRGRPVQKPARASPIPGANATANGRSCSPK